MPVSEARKRALKKYYEKNKENLLEKMRDRKSWLKFYQNHKEEILETQSAKYYFLKEVRDDAEAAN